IRRRRASQPERTESASGISGLVPYIGHSTVPTTRPRASATRNPAVRRGAMARALTGANLFPACEENPSVPVKLLLERESSPLAGHRHPGDAQQHEVAPGEPGDEPAGEASPAALPPEREGGREQQHEHAGVGGEEPDPEPRRVVVAGEA